MKPRTLFYTLIILVLGIVAAGATGYYYASGIVNRQSETLRMKLADQQVDDQSIEALNRLKHQYEQVQPYLSLLDQALPHAKDQSQFVLQLQQLAASNGMAMGGVVFQGGNGALPSPTSGTVASSGVLAIPMQMSLTGSYTQMEGFLRGLETMNRYANVASIAITTNKPQSVTFALTINALFKP